GEVDQRIGDVGEARRDAIHAEVRRGGLDALGRGGLHRESAGRRQLGEGIRRRGRGGRDHVALRDGTVGSLRLRGGRGPGGAGGLRDRGERGGDAHGESVPATRPPRIRLFSGAAPQRVT